MARHRVLHDSVEALQFTGSAESGREIANSFPGHVLPLEAYRTSHPVLVIGVGLVKHLVLKGDWVVSVDGRYPRVMTDHEFGHVYDAKPMPTEAKVAAPKKGIGLAEPIPIPVPVPYDKPMPKY